MQVNNRNNKRKKKKKLPQTKVYACCPVYLFRIPGHLSGKRITNLQSLQLCIAPTLSSINKCLHGRKYHSLHIPTLPFSHPIHPIRRLSRTNCDGKTQGRDEKEKKNISGQR